MNSEEDGLDKGLSPHEFYEVFYSSLPHGVIVLKNDTIFYANEAFADLVGHSLEEVTRWSTDDLFNLLLTEQSELKTLYHKGGDPEIDGNIYSYQILTHDGKIKHLEMIPVRFLLHGDKFYHATLFDVSDRVQAIQDMKESEERFRKTFDSIPDQAYLWEKDDDGEIMLKMANKRAVEMSQGTVNQHLGKNPYSLFVDNPEFSEYIRFTMDTGQSIRTETIVTHPHMPATAVAIINCVKPADNLVLMINTDITREREAQDIAKRSEQEKSIVLDSMQDYLIYYENQDLTISWTNKAAADSLNCMPADLIGKHCHELWPGKPEPCRNCPVKAVWITGTPQVKEMTTPEDRIWSVKGLPIKNMAEHVIAVVEIWREITSEKKADLATREAKSRAELYLDLLSHDLNNIHQGIIISLQLALQNDSLPTNLKDVLQTSLEQVNRGVNLIRNVQKFTTILDSPVCLAPMDLIPIIESAVKVVRNAYPQRKLVVKLHATEREVIVNADEFLIDAIFNLFHNTMKHDTKKTVNIDVRIEQGEDLNFTKLSLEDRGPGLDEKTKREILARLNSGLKTGTGMGLTLVNRIIERYGGNLAIEDRVQSDYTQGACFSLYFPKKVD